MLVTSLKTPQPPTSLKILHYLQPRMPLQVEDKINIQNLNKGVNGERKFFQILKDNLLVDCLILYGLNLEVDQTEFQIDCLMIFQNDLMLIEVKNYNGDFYVKDDSWYSVATGNEIRNPIHQIKRSEILFRKLLKQLGYKYSVKASIVFINKEFFLYQAPLDQSLIFPNQIQRFINKLNNMTSKITKKHENIANQLVKQLLPISSHERLPKYNYDQLKKGIVCNSCQKFLKVLSRTNLWCDQCNKEENVDSAVMRSVAEFYLLFPNKRITTATIHEWCKIISSKKAIRRILKENLEYVNNGKYSYYIVK